MMNFTSPLNALVGGAHNFPSPNKVSWGGGIAKRFGAVSGKVMKNQHK